MPVYASYATEGEALRDYGTAVALNNAGATWKEQAQSLATKFFITTGDQGATFDDARAYALSNGLSDPPHSNAWGAIALSLSKKQIIERTGEWVKSATPKNHARACPKWRIKR